MTQTELIALAHSAASVYGLDGVLVCAVVEQESDWHQWTNRYELGFETNPTYGPTVLSQAHVFAAAALAEHGYETTWQTEVKNRCTSWGLMQLLGQSAREDGFTEPIPSLCDPALGLDAGCRKLSRLLKAADGDVFKGLLAWNGGGDPQYAAKVLARKGRYR